MQPIKSALLNIKMATGLCALLITSACSLAEQNATTPATTSQQNGSHCVILIHGLARTQRSMQPMAKALTEEGYTVINHSYPSRKETVAELATTLSDPIAACKKSLAPDAKIHFVTHSLGGILLRAYVKAVPLQEMGRVVMLGPPNQGSEVVDTLKDIPGFEILNGPAGLELGTGDTALPNTLGPVTFELGVIAGTLTVNPILSQMLPSPNDGKVSVASTKVDGMKQHLTVKTSHTFMMRNQKVITAVKQFIATGRFEASS